MSFLAPKDSIGNRNMDLETQMREGRLKYTEIQQLYDILDAHYKHFISMLQSHVDDAERVKADHKQQIKAYKTQVEVFKRLCQCKILESETFKERESEVQLKEAIKNMQSQLIDIRIFHQYEGELKILKEKIVQLSILLYDTDEEIKQINYPGRKSEINIATSKINDLDARGNLSFMPGKKPIVSKKLVENLINQIKILQKKLNEANQMNKISSDFSQNSSPNQNSNPGNQKPITNLNNFNTSNNNPLNFTFSEQQRKQFENFHQLKEQFADLLKRFVNKRDQFQILQTKIDALKAQNEMLQQLLQTMESNQNKGPKTVFSSGVIDVSQVQIYLEEFFQEIDGQRRKVRELREEVAEKFSEMKSQIISDCQNKIAAYLETNEEQYTQITEFGQRELSKARYFFNQAIRARGGFVRNFAQIRPLLSSSAHLCVTSDKETSRILKINDVNGNEGSYQFDKVYLPSQKNEAIVNDVQDIVESVMTGGSGNGFSLLAHGQSGAGQTHTLFSSSLADPGLAFQILQYAFDLKEEYADTFEYTFNVSFFQIHNGQLRDLLVEESQKKLDVKMNEKGQVLVTDLTVFKFQMFKQLQTFIDYAFKNKQQTKTEEQNNLAHFVFSVYITVINQFTKTEEKTKINFVELPGFQAFENTEDGISQSYQALTDVICSKMTNQNFMPFFSSQLTTFLQDTVNQNSKVLNIFNVCPQFENFEQSIRLLQYSQKFSSLKNADVLASGVISIPPREQFA